MKIETVKPVELLDVYYLFQECAKDMNRRGLCHWNHYNPDIDTLSQKINNKTLFTIKHLGICIGSFVLDEEPLSEYSKINWSGNGSKTLNIHWLAIHPLWQNKGIDRQLITFAENYAKEKGYGAIRTDVYALDEPGIIACNTQGYSEKGEIYLPYQKTPFKCFEKIVK